MDYYKMKMMINQDTDQHIINFLNEKKALSLDFSDIIFKSEGRFGFGKKIILERASSWVRRFPEVLQLNDTKLIKLFENDKEN